MPVQEKQQCIVYYHVLSSSWTKQLSCNSFVLTVWLFYNIWKYLFTILSQDKAISPTFDWLHVAADLTAVSSCFHKTIQGGIKAPAWPALCV